MVRCPYARRFTLMALAAAFTACSEPPSAPSETALTLLPDRKKSELIECPTDVTQSASALLGVLGGDVFVGGNLVSVPEGALPPLGLALVTITAPASKYVEIEVRVNELPHFTFESPVTITIDYSRCTRSNVDREPLQAWYIDAVTKVPLDDMGGVDDKVARTVTFTTDHFSGYAVAQ